MSEGKSVSKDEEIDSEVVDDDDDDDDDDESDSDDDGFRGAKVRGENYDQLKQMQRRKKVEKKNRGKKAKRPVMYEANDLGDAGNAALHAGFAETSAQKKLKEKVRRMNIPLEKRFRMKEEEEPFIKITNKGGSKEITYIPKDSRSKKRPKSTDDSESDEHVRPARNRRGIKDLNLRRSA
jgi:hypothetical protein